MTIDIVALILIPALVAAAIRIVFRQTRASFTAFSFGAPSPMVLETLRSALLIGFNRSPGRSLPCRISVRSGFSRRRIIWRIRWS